LVLFGIHNSTSGPYSAAINRILISIMSREHRQSALCLRPSVVRHRQNDSYGTGGNEVAKEVHTQTNRTHLVITGMQNTWSLLTHQFAP
jgi:hypothetical protein